jgi:hypothetical protein
MCVCVCALSDRNFFPAVAPRVFQSPLHEPMTVLMRNEHRALAAAVVSALSKSLVPLGAACAHQSFFESILIPAQLFFPLFPSAAPVLIIVFAKVRDLIIYSAASRHLADELLGQRGGFFLEKKETPAQQQRRQQRQHPTSPFAARLSGSVCVCCIFSARASRRRGCRFSPIITAQPLLKKCVPESGARTHTRAFSGINLSWVDGEKIYHTRYYVCAGKSVRLSYLAAGSFLLVIISLS